MISIIICSRSQELLKSISDNICLTIGTEYEIVSIDNSMNKLSISSAYNQGASVAKFQTLCFVHEDVSFITKNWGKIIEVA